MCESIYNVVLRSKILKKIEDSEGLSVKYWVVVTDHNALINWKNQDSEAFLEEVLLFIWLRTVSRVSQTEPSESIII